VHELSGGSAHLAEAIRLVVDEDGHVPQPVCVLPAVVGTEEQLGTVNEPHADVGLSPATIASIDVGES